MMKSKIRAAIQSGHSSILNGISSDKATDAVDRLFKVELDTVLSEIEDCTSLKGAGQAMLLIDFMRRKYELV